ncbi:hypothetical protein [Pseudoalteromonas xiamenensis]|uniref:Uncharacterized protein n=1 Tax=Pseudoalteromonas xiamenensis TaxID=882626 RepID=A0A975DHS9_9GAMM|nr:hypothetical protein [Pseudoalteromonas xiamenensis]QTH72018.1 hypothetical protein J5O05_03665 [Pseudoalteromonas xiamenensis]
MRFWTKNQKKTLCQKTVFLKSQRLDDLDALLEEEPEEDVLSEDGLLEDPETRRP